MKKRRAKTEAEMMRQEAELLRQGVAQAAQIVAEAGGMVLFDRAGRPFAFYPPRLPQQIEDPGAPGRLRELVERRSQRSQLPLGSGEEQRRAPALEGFNRGAA